MKRYVILTQYEATPKCRDYGTPDASQTWFSGVGTYGLNQPWEKHMNEDGSELDMWLVKHEGYKTKSGAERGLKVANRINQSETQGGSWVITSSIVELDIAE